MVTNDGTLITRGVYDVVSMPEYAKAGYKCSIAPFSLPSVGVGSRLILEFDLGRITGRGGNGHYAPIVRLKLVEGGRGGIYVIPLSKLQGLRHRGLRLKLVPLLNPFDSNLLS